MAVKETNQTSNSSLQAYAETKDSGDQKRESKAIHTEPSKKEKKPLLGKYATSKVLLGIVSIFIVLMAIASFIPIS